MAGRDTQTRSVVGYDRKYLEGTRALSEITWLDDAAGRDVAPRLRIMRPAEICYDLLERPVRGLVRALNSCGAVETLSSCGGHPFDSPLESARAWTAWVLVHVLDEPAWRCAVTAIAEGTRTVPAVSLAVSFDHQALLRLAVPAGLAPGERRLLLNTALGAAARALEARATHAPIASAGD